MDLVPIRLMSCDRQLLGPLAVRRHMGPIRHSCHLGERAIAIDKQMGRTTVYFP